MAPVIARLQERDDLFETRVCLTGQHKELSDPALQLFRIRCDYDFNIVREGAGLTFITNTILKRIAEVLDDFPAERVLVHGDTTTTFAGSLGAFYRQIPVAHVEAGLRSGRLDAPWPEEANRRLTSVLADLHFAPTELARQNLLHEGVADQSIVVTGNTVVDALLYVVKLIQDSKKFRAELGACFRFLDPAKRLVLVTGHRRESFGEGFQRICEALGELSRRTNVQIVYPVHLNPGVRNPVHRYLQGLANVHLIEPLSYEAFVYLMMQASVILTDSGGVQEEAPSLGKPVLVMRDVTERPEALEMATAELVGTDVARITAAAARILDAPAKPLANLPVRNPFGDGKAAERIVVRLAARGT